MTDERTGILRFCTLVAIATLTFSGCRFIDNETAAESSDAGGTTDSDSGVVPVSSGPRSLIIDWSAPTAYDDGSALTDLSGYKVYYGTSPGVYDFTIEIMQVGISTYVIDGLAAGTYYVAMSSINSAGVESALSYEVNRTLL